MIMADTSSLPRKVLRISARLCVPAVVFFVLFELVVRLVMPVDTFIAVPNRWDQATGLRMIENSHGSINRPEYSCEFHVNSRGLRERETPLSASSGEHRILFLGDSYTCGFGVDAEKTFSRVVEQDLQRRTINAGVGATGTAQQLAYYLDEGHLYGADLVVLSFVANDFGDSVGSGLFTWDDNVLTRHDAPRTTATSLMEFTRRLPGYHSILGHSHALARLKQGFAGWWYQRRGGGGRVYDTDNVMPERRMGLSVKLVQELDAAVRDHGAQLLVVFVPLAPGLDVSAEPMHEAACRIRFSGIPVLEMEADRDRFTAEGIATYYADDGHWTPEGHHQFGLVIAGAIREMVSTP
jgi:hypothetical protein